jgi:alkylhydroperoxidase family enzyme
MTATAVDLAAVNGGRDDDGGVAHGRRLVAFTEAVMGSDDAALAGERRALRAVLDDDAFVDVAAVIGSFNVVDRIADATGIPLDDALRAAGTDVCRELDLARFASAANTPGARGGA